YAHLLPETERLRSALSSGVPRWEERLAGPCIPIIRTIIIRALRIDPLTVDRARRKVLALFSTVEARLADGRPFRTRDPFTAPDPTFAALAYPVLFPEPLAAAGNAPAFAEVPAGLRVFVEELRATTAGRFALHLYDTERARRLTRA